MLVALALTIVMGSLLKTQERPRQATSPGTGAEGRPLEDVRPIEDVGSPPPMSVGVGLDAGPLSVGRHALIAEGVPFSLRVPSGWENHGDIYISKNTVEAKSAEAIIYWTSIADGAHRSCGQWWGSPVGSLADYAASAARTPGTDLISGPSNIAISGRTVQRVVFTVRKDVGCNPGFFYTWDERNPSGGIWTTTEVGDTIRVWLVKLGGRFLYIEGDTHDNAGPDLGHEILQIVGSIRFGVGSAALPPEGATPSIPARGELVMSFYGRAQGIARSAVFVYADGRLIWQRDAGFLEQRLTPEGVELLRSEVTSSGLFGDELDLAERGLLDATPGSALERLVPRLTDPGSWLPASAWKDREIRAYVPSRYEVCYEGSERSRTRILTRLPAPAIELLHAEDSCSELTDEEARAIAEALGDAWIERDGSEHTHGPAYRLQGRSIFLRFEPILPHGEVGPRGPG